MEIEKAKSDIIYFAENGLALKLLDSQKGLLRQYQKGEVILCGKGLKGEVVKTVIKKHKILCRGPVKSNRNTK
ncbi:hypothetical protein JOC94_004669 [Bacillus thermophilus]|uniref:Uncharacterized protein n=1 Tax=Siminovitchia thermophila TaxID=1245522 RepID=A0ABS2RD93_9BACI|nr:hypothetical protein [Siminovitchia thermophila]MBM7717638.1 hypothetical protein [Siminovitchia thermophila]